MSKKYLFDQYRINEERLTFAERKRRKEEGIPIKEFLVLTSKTENFIDKLFGITEFYFVPKTDGLYYQLNMMQQLIKHSLNLLNKASMELDESLFNWANFLLQGLHKLMSSQGWKNNQLLRKEIESFNSFMSNVENVDLRFNLQFTESPVVKKCLEFYVNNENDTIVSENGISKDEFQDYEPMMLYEELNFNSIEKLEGSINALVDFIQGISIRQSYSKDNINYINGETDDFIHTEVIWAAKSLSRTIRYLINSSSWRNNELYNFDEFELENKSKYRINEQFCDFYEQNVLS